MKYLVTLICFIISSQIGQSQTEDGIEQIEYPRANGCKTFYVLPGETYVVSAWVKEKHPEQKFSYTNSDIGILYLDTENNALQQEITFPPNGNVIDGWQRIIGIVAIPEKINDIRPEKIVITLNNRSSDIDCYFDDVRAFPYNSSMKSFVYDEYTQRLVAELDENNYATFYEYDKEGGLIRVKKETEKGIYTIQETRSSTSKQD